MKPWADPEARTKVRAAAQVAEAVETNGEAHDAEPIKFNGAADTHNSYALPDFPAIARLKRDRKWVAWKYVPQENAKPKKVPVCPQTGRNAAVDNPSTWDSHAQAVARALRDQLPGVGYVLTDDDNLTGIDLDNVRDATTGELTPWASAIVEFAESYTEVSPSGTGLRILSAGKIDQSIVNTPLGVEVYPTGRYLTITGQYLEGTPTDILPAPKTLAALRARVNGANKPQPSNSRGNGKDESQWSQLNTAALQNLSAWVPALFGSKAVSKKGCYRVSSKALGRNLQEALSLTPKGIKDFGVHDMDDPRGGKRSPIDVVKEHGGKNFLEAVEWLCKRLDRRLPPGWQSVHSASNDTHAPALVATPYVWRDPATISPRDFLYGKHLIRKFLSGKVSQGGVGKSTLIAAETLAMVSGRNLLGILPSRPLRVWLWNLEDPVEETERKIQAAAMHYNLMPRDIESRLFVDSGRDQKLVIAETTRDGARIVRPVVDSLIEQIIAKNIDVLIIDPFVSSHRVTENSNDDMDLVVKQWSAIAELGDCAVELVHHSKKGELEKTVESSRGAIAITDACRSVQVLNRMTKEEAERAGVQNHRLYFRVYADKANLAPPVETSNWFQLENVNLGNGPHFEGMGGDEVGVVTAWRWPDVMAGITDVDFEKVAAEIRAAKWRENAQAKNWVGHAVAKALDLDAGSRTGRAKIGAMLKAWLAVKLLVVVDGIDEKSMPKKFVEVAEKA